MKTQTQILGSLEAIRGMGSTVRPYPTIRPGDRGLPALSVPYAELTLFPVPPHELRLFPLPPQGIHAPNTLLVG